MESASKLPGTSRVEAFSDAVIAILMTIMVLDLRPPGSELKHHTFAELVHYLTPKLTVYALSFVIIAKMWVSHHRLFCAAKHVTTRLLWLNNLLQFWMSLIPFATGFVSEDQTRPIAVATYGMVLCLNAFSFTCDGALCARCSAGLRIDLSVVCAVHSGADHVDSNRPLWKGRRRLICFWWSLRSRAAAGGFGLGTGFRNSGLHGA
jgi:hypothetical protein